MLPWWYWAVTGALLGSVLGSFAGVVIERTPRGIPLTGRSRCACGRALRPWENIPVLGWVSVRGRARCCGARIPAWYVGVEVLWGGACALAGGMAGLTGVLAALGAGFVALGVAVAVLTSRSRRSR